MELFDTETFKGRDEAAPDHAELGSGDCESDRPIGSGLGAILTDLIAERIACVPVDTDAFGKVFARNLFGRLPRSGEPDEQVITMYLD